MYNNYFFFTFFLVAANFSGDGDPEFVKVITCAVKTLYMPNIKYHRVLNYNVVILLIIRGKK